MSNNESGKFTPRDLSNWFWDIVAKAKQNPIELRAILFALQKDEIKRFHSEFMEAAIELTDEPFQKHMFGNSEDGVADIVEWVVSQGKEYYWTVWHNPNLIPPFLDDDVPSLAGVAPLVYWQKYGEDLELDF